MIVSTKEREETKVKDGVRAAENRDKRNRKRMPVHGRSLEAVMNAMKKKAKGG